MLELLEYVCLCLKFLVCCEIKFFCFIKRLLIKNILIFISISYVLIRFEYLFN